MSRCFYVHTVLIVCCQLVAFCDAALAAEWATLKGQFVYDGAVPKPKTIVPTKDVDFCGKVQIPDERLIVNQENAGIANIILYLRKKPSKISSSYGANASQEIRLDNIGCRFEPHVQLIQTSQELIVGNKDAVGHNTNFAAISNALPNQLVPALGQYVAQFLEPELRPVKVDCNIHPWMSAYVVVKDHPYVAKTDADGRFEIKDLPCGEKLDIRIWHESSGWVRKVKSENIKFSKKGIKLMMDSDVDLGTVKVNAASFD